MHTRGIARRDLLKRPSAFLVFAPVAITLFSGSAFAASPTSTCTVVLSGAAGIVNGTYPCSPRVVYSFPDHRFAFTLALTTPASGSILQLAIAVDAPQLVLKPAGFTLGAAGATGGTALTETAGPTKLVWAALTTPASTAPQAAADPQTSAVSQPATLVGQSALTLTDLGPITPERGNRRQLCLSPTGTLEATMESQTATGAQGTVTLQLTFGAAMDPGVSSGSNP
jgi:hypothetical protein